jgi:hypothetical protein
MKSAYFATAAGAEACCAETEEPESAVRTAADIAAAAINERKHRVGVTTLLLCRPGQPFSAYRKNRR